MLQKIIIVLTVLVALWLNMAQINAQELSTNPWLEANDEEAVEAVYQKEQKRARRQSTLQYQTEETTTINRTHAYIQPEESGEDEGFFDSVKNLMSDDEEQEQALIPNTQANRQAIARQKQQQQQQQQQADSGSMFNFGNLQNSLKLPQLPSATGLIQKFERATGVDFKSMGKYLQ